MDPRIMKSFSDNLLFGGTLVAAGSTAGLWLPFSTAVLLLAVVWGGIVWIVSSEQDTARRDQRALAGAALGWSLAAGAALHAVVPLTVAAGAVALCLALRQADYMALRAAERQSSATRTPAPAEKAPPTALPRRPD